VKRIVQPEWLDTLPPDNPRAIHSRRDLQRVNLAMRNADIMAGALRSAQAGRALKKITELGAGDGNFLLSLAQKLSPIQSGLTATLLDLQDNIPTETLAAFTALGWQPEVVIADVFDWPQTSGPGGVVIANLFLHHFENNRLAALLGQIAHRADLFMALEPRRAAWPLFCSHLLWGIGCNDVTRHDAVISVKAGFDGHELSALWPYQLDWRLTEHRAGTFSHLFIAQRIS
jgi:hypothetical protein